MNIELRPLDAVLDTSGARAFIKLDVEGHELSALKEMQAYLQHNYCILQIELWETHEAEVTDWLAQNGYQPFDRILKDVYFKPA
ncbi:MAG TPA: hypothetical protein ENJ42_10020 [Hellea balneolensis]|uniref:Methyltransferase FkbM domain-containing protein n=1 Tax=Hellea balneolensis TaxID=287478 RepID=A0A7C5R1P0_9PROT|nr:hypothetical protein [Hellea balneolensis]